MEENFQGQGNLGELVGGRGDGQGVMRTYDTNVDIVFVIDATESMQTTIDMVKDTALSFYERLIDRLNDARRRVTNLRIKVAWFRDYYCDGDKAYGESKFFELPDEQGDFRDFVTGIEAKGGGDDPESALEALTLAMRSDFVQDGAKKRHIIVLFTDAGAHPLEDHDSLVAENAKKYGEPRMYPENMPKDLSEFCEAWQGNDQNRVFGNNGESTKLDPRSRRLIVFTPNAYPWTDLEVTLDWTIRKSIKPNEGGAELDMNEVYNFIADSMN